MLTQKQQEVIKYFWKAGRFRAEDLRVSYTSVNTIADAISRFSSLGIISMEEDTNYFKINRERFLDLQNEEY